LWCGPLACKRQAGCLRHNSFRRLTGEPGNPAPVKADKKKDPEEDHLTIELEL
jgi:hypothetical protein